MTLREWINSTNMVNAKSLTILWLWLWTFVGTFAVAFVCMIWKLTCPVELIGLWYGGLVAFSGVGYLSQKDYRGSDWMLNAIKTGNPDTVAAVQAAKATTAEQPTK